MKRRWIYFKHLPAPEAQGFAVQDMDTLCGDCVDRRNISYLKPTCPECMEKKELQKDGGSQVPYQH